MKATEQYIPDISVCGIVYYAVHQQNQGGSNFCICGCNLKSKCNHGSLSCVAGISMWRK